jgi:hypothetical protein
MSDEFDTFDFSRDLGHAERRLHMIANHMLSYNLFTISSSIFQNLFTLLAKEKAIYYALVYFSFLFFLVSRFSFT